MSKQSKLNKLEKMYGEILWTDKPHNVFGLPINFTRFVMTEKRLIARRGFLNIKEDYIELYRIVDTAINLPLGQRMFGCGVLTVFSKDQTHPEFKLEKIKTPHTVHKLLDETVETQKKTYGILGKDMYGAARTVDVDCDCDPDDGEEE